LVPATVAQQCGFLGRADDINKQDSGKNAAGLDATAQRTMPDEYRFQQLFISMAAPPRNCSFHVLSRPLLRTTANCFFPRSSRPVDPTAMANSAYLDGAHFKSTVDPVRPIVHALDVYPLTFE
jgi:hypothetical protein